MNSIIRPIEIKDLNEILKIEEESFISPWSKNIFLRDLDNSLSNMYLIEENKIIVGYIIYWIILDEIHLLNIAIRKMARGRGLGKSLIEYMLIHGKTIGIKHIDLEVREDNFPAIRLYDMLGFKKIGKIDNYYQKEKKAALLLRKEIK